MSSAIIFFSFMLIGSLSSVLGVSIHGMSINRIFNNIPLASIESSVCVVDKTGEFHPHYNRTTLEKNVNAYLVKNLDGYIDKYKIRFSYYKIVDDQYVVDGSMYPEKVDIYFKCNYCTYLTYEGYRNFEIERMI